MTLYPAFAAYVKNAFQILGSVTAMSPGHCGFIMLPVFQKQTTDVARIKHRRAIEDFLIKGSMSYGQEVAVLYNKPDSGPRDGRPMSQVCVLTWHTSYKDSSPWSESDAMTSGRIGPYPLIRISDMVGYDEATRPSASARVEQRGVACASQLMEGLLEGMSVRDTDRVVWLDVIPNRQAEFARAALAKLLESPNATKTAKYVGLVREEKDSNLDVAPPKERPPSSTAAPTAETLGLSIIPMVKGKPSFPTSVLLNRFSEGSVEQDAIKEMEKAFHAEFGEVPSSRTTDKSASGDGDGHRSCQVCDYSVDEGLKPLDCSRRATLPTKPVAEFTQERLGAVPGKNGKPTMVLSADFHVWLLNTSEEPMDVPPGELFGFGTGEAEETTGLVWRLLSDRDILAFEKSPLPLCELLRKLTVEQGLMLKHYRWEVSSLTSKKTCIYKPNAVTAENGDVKKVSFGGLFGSNYHKVQSASSPPKLMPVKPKVYLLARLTIPAGSCVDLSAAEAA
ncbi:FO synthase subunit 1 [Durusdinium trenchii]|uniref:FO synthase subunit 1 n=1 Tax=Durusdinium trenchii TaxID=1381693 RepID=A0ABP0RDU2_9DINO